MEATKIIGPYDLIITIEKFPNDRSVTKEIRSSFNVEKYDILDCEEVLKDSYVPETIFEIE